MQKHMIDVLDRFGSCRAPSERWSQLSLMMKDHGSEWITLGSASPEALEAPLIRSSTPVTLMSDYMREKIHLEDPWMRICANSRNIDTLLVDKALSRGCETSVTTRMCEIFHDHGIDFVMLVPILSYRQVSGGVMYSRDPKATEQLNSPRSVSDIRLILALFALASPPGEGIGESGVYDARVSLSPREAEVMKWLAAGLRTSGIADRMNIQDVSVSKHLSSVRQKLGARTREQALALAISRGHICP